MQGNEEKAFENCPQKSQRILFLIQAASKYMGRENEQCESMANKRSGAALDLLSRGWNVAAIDSSQVALNHFQQRIQGQPYATHVQALPVKIEDLEWRDRPFEMIIAAESLPFCDPAQIQRIVTDIFTHTKQ